MAAKTLHVELLTYTPEPDMTVALAAKQCYSNASLDELQERISGKDQSKFIAMLMSRGHLSPIEHVSFTFGIEGVSRALLAQITRHRLASFSVKSQRYVSAHSTDERPCFDYIIPPSIKALGTEAEERFASQMAQMQTWYDEWQQQLTGGDLTNTKFNEDARFVLPNAAETKIIMTMNARELLHFFELRCCSRAQWEIRALAEQMLFLCRGAAPLIFAEAGPPCVRGNCPEGKNTCGRINEMRERYGSKLQDK